MPNYIFRHPNLLMLPCLVGSLSLFSSLTSATEDIHLNAGVYILNGGNGILSLKPSNKKDSFYFSIHTDWANGHMCDLDGRVIGGRATLEGEESNKPCIIEFSAKQDGVEVKDDHEVCARYCGVRAGMTGLYLKPAAGCSRREVSETRAKFTNLYRKGNYEEAEVTLKPLVSSCQAYIDFVRFAWIRNDLAIAQYKLGLLSDCRVTLEPLADSAVTYDGVEENDPSVLPELLPLIPVMKATLTNLRLCKKNE